MRRKGFTLVELMICILVISILMALLLPALSAAVTSARNAQSLNNLRSLGQAMHEFHDANGNFPKAGAESIFVQLLPFLERQALADKIDETLADPTKNRCDAALVATPSGDHLAGLILPMFVHPGFDHQTKTFTVSGEVLGDASTADITYSMVTYRGMRGSLTGNANHPEAGLFGNNVKRSVELIPDGLTNTLAIGEAMWTDDKVIAGTFCNDSRGAVRGWFKSTGTDGRWDTAQITNNATAYHPPATPLDTTAITTVDALPFNNGNGKDGAAFVLADGSTTFISQDIDADVLKALSIIDDGAVNEYTTINH